MMAIAVDGALLVLIGVVASASLSLITAAVGPADALMSADVCGVLFTGQHHSSDVAGE
jgi:hypothetical protein